MVGPIGRRPSRTSVAKLPDPAGEPQPQPRCERNPDEKLGDRTQGRTYLPDHLIRVNDAAKRSRQIRFTALLHHVDVEALERAFRRLRRQAAPGVDGMTVETYDPDGSTRTPSRGQKFEVDFTAGPSGGVGRASLPLIVLTRYGRMISRRDHSERVDGS